MKEKVNTEQVYPCFFGLTSLEKQMSYHIPKELIALFYGLVLKGNFHKMVPAKFVEVPLSPQRILKNSASFVILGFIESDK